MLFDLRSAGRRRTIKVVYVFLAIIMAGGLVFLGVGSGTGGGGLLDAIKSPFGGGSSSSSAYEKQEKKLVAAVKANPNDANSWTRLVTVRLQEAQVLGKYDQKTQTVTYTDKSREKLSQAGQAWDSYIALKPKKPNSTVATQMVQAYGPQGLNIPTKALEVQEVVTKARPSFASYQALAYYAYLADEIKKGDAAAKKAVALAPKAQKKIVKNALNQIKAQVVVEKLKAEGKLKTPKNGSTQNKK